jgi:hypothetical protein
MNERIRKLAEQAGLEYNFDPMLWLKYEKFAELIIQESITRITRMGILNNCEEQSKMACDELKEHFGIEE